MFVRFRALVPLAALIVLIGAGCRRQSRPPDSPPDAAPRESIPDWYPVTLDPAAYAGAGACAECHRDQFERWRGSPHGRAMAEPGPASVLGDFGGGGLTVDGRRITALREGDRYFMRIDGDDSTQRWPVDLVLASGRQHQLYLTRGRDGGFRILPIYWATKTREWVDMKLHRGISMDPAHPRYWARADIVSEGNCFYCHLSQGRARADGAHIEQAWVDLSVNCEGCHGPARGHVEARRAKRKPEEGRLRDLRLLDKVEEARLCGRCHSAQHTFHEDGSLDLPYMTLASNLYRSNTTQFGAGYQFAGHVTSACFNRGALTCSACHDPHRQNARDLAGKSAEGAASDGQCTVCHRNLIDSRESARHSHHKPETRCVGCHMPRHFLFDDPASRQAVSDHSISIPRPRETLELRQPNACNACHADKTPEWALSALDRWGQRRATTVRDSVRAFALTRRRDLTGPALLLDLLGAEGTPQYLRAAALDLLATTPPDPRVVPVLAALTGERDFYLRALALRALWRHDPSRRDMWMANLVADPHPLARLVLLANDGPAPPLSAEQYRALAADAVRLSTIPPGPALAAIAEMAERAGRIDEARRLAGLAATRSTPLQVSPAGR